jgi:hypothetical protein
MFADRIFTTSALNRANSTSSWPLFGGPLFPGPAIVVSVTCWNPWVLEYPEDPGLDETAKPEVV